jgi:curved DNA-binding protein
MSARDALEVLGLESAADPAGLRGAYLAAVKRAHPDRPGGDAERLRQVIEAYEALRDRRAPEPAIEFTSTESPPPRPTSRRLEISTMEAVFGGSRAVPMRGCGDVQVRLPPGLRDGDLIVVSGVPMTVAIVVDDRAAIVGDNLCLRIKVERAFLHTGGALETPTPAGPFRVQVSRQDAARGLVRVDAAQLPTQGRRAPINLVIKLEAAPRAAGDETRTRTLLRRFTANWAA